MNDAWVSDGDWFDQCKVFPEIWSKTEFAINVLSEPQMGACMQEVLSVIAERWLKSLSAPKKTALLQKLLSMTTPEWQLRNGQLTMVGSLANLHSNGICPRAVLDIGAHVGAWTRTAASIFTEARFHMVEARPEQKPKLETVAKALNGRAGFSISLLGAEDKESVPFYYSAMGTGTGSSVLEETTNFERRIVPLEMCTLDALIEKENLKGPFFIKLDVQGYELEVLKGGAAAIADTEAVLMEVALIEYNRGAPLINEVFEFLNSFGFVPYDFCSQHRRASDCALFQTDIIFVRRESGTRAKKRFWEHEP